jgi:hypothetical protein
MVTEQGGLVKKVLLISVLMIGLLAVACDKQGALERILEEPATKSYILQQMFADEATRAEMADSTFANVEIMNAYLTKLATSDDGKSRLLSFLVAADTTGEWICERLAENDEIKKAMKQASR